MNEDTQNGMKLVNANEDSMQVLVTMINHWNDDKCRWECKKIIDKGVCDKIFIWNPSNCACECDKSCNAGEYLDYENCTCRKKVVDKLTEECTENVEEVKLAKIASGEDENKHE